MAPTVEELRIRFEQWPDEDLLAVLRAEAGYTDLAVGVALEVLEERGVDPENAAAREPDPGLDRASGDAETADPDAVEDYRLEQKMKNGANWFYWIAALSILNTLLAASESGWSFIFGLGATQVVDAVLAEASAAARAVGFGLDAIVAGVFALVGLLSRKYRWVFIVGLAFYALDALLFLLAAELVGFGFHVFAAVGMIAGYGAARQLAARGRAREVGERSPGRAAGLGSAEAPVPDAQAG